MGSGSSEFAQRMEFSDVRVAPIEAVLDGPILGSEFRGGPIWPDFKRQVLARHCRGAVARPIDDPPLQTGGEAEALAHGVWCGPIVRHFGHMIADFGMRIVASAHLEPDAPLVFSDWPRAKPPSPFFQQILDHWGIPKERVRFVCSPVNVGTLVVYPQAERRPDAGPSEAYLDLLDSLSSAVRPASQKDIDTLYVSRSASVVGGLAAEAYIESVLSEMNVSVFHPESVTVREQLDVYGRARRLIFCEGSAVHGLQLLGRLDADVVIIGRRPGSTLAKASLLPRCRSLTYIDALAGLVYGLRPSGWPQTPKGVGVLHERRFLEQMSAAGLHLRPFWSSEEYRRRRDHDLERWRAGRPPRPAGRLIEPLLVEHLIRRAQNRDR